MSRENDEKINFIKHYKESIDKHLNEPERVLHCLKKLQNVRINVSHLQETKIGRTVNSCRKLEGEAGELANILIDKWKSLVPPSASSESESDIKSFSKNIHHSSSSKKSSSSDKKEHSSSEKKSSSKHHHKHHKSKRSNEHTSSSSLLKSSHNDREKRKSSSEGSIPPPLLLSKKRSHEEAALHHQSKENDSKKFKVEDAAGKSEKSKDQKSHKSSSNGHHKNSGSSSSRKDKKKDEEKSKEYDVSQGIGFAEALASFDMPTTSNSSTKHQKKDQLADKIVSIKSTSSKSSLKSSSSSSSDLRPSTSNESFKPIKSLTTPPKLLIQKPKMELNLSDIASDLPNISIPEYRPLPLNSVMKDYINSNVYGTSSTLSRHEKPKNDAEILAESFSSKANRTRVFSGNAKTRSQIPKLFDMCIRILQENIDYLEDTGGVPFDLLKPVLEKAKPTQLSNIEYYNPYLLEESDVLWRPHCQKKWKNKFPMEMETWRDMYERCTREDEEKLSRLTQHIRHNQEVTSSGIQKTKMAFVHTMVKPPRNVMRKQEQFGTNSKLVVSPAARVESLKALVPNISKPGDVRLRVAAGLRDDAQQVVGRGNGHRAGMVTKKAPMMAKILSKFKR